MENLIIAKTESTPEIHFDYSSGILEIRGESYPESTTAFYVPIFKWLNECLDDGNERPLTMNMEILYANSSSSKVLMNLFTLLDKAVSKGKKITLNWIYEEEDETALEHGEEFKEDVELLEFNFVVKSA